MTLHHRGTTHSNQYPEQALALGTCGTLIAVMNHQESPYRHSLRHLSSISGQQHFSSTVTHTCGDCAHFLGSDFSPKMLTRMQCLPLPIFFRASYTSLSTPNQQHSLWDSNLCVPCSQTTWQPHGKLPTFTINSKAEYIYCITAAYIQCILMAAIEQAQILPLFTPPS